MTIIIYYSGRSELRQADIAEAISGSLFSESCVIGGGFRLAVNRGSPPELTIGR